MFGKVTFAAFALGLKVAVDAHMVIQSPAPYSISQKSPLNADGSNWPCQAPADYSAGTVANIQSGSAQTIQFNLGGGANTATHGGGSCQVSINYNTDAAGLKDPANWKVLHSWQGGCPVDAVGNLNNAIACLTGDEDNCVRSLSYTMPSEAPNGKAIMAWTWFNNIGNREMYMNCFPAQISGSSGSQSTLNSLPQMMVANIGSVSGGCGTTENHNIEFPNPGKYLTSDAGSIAMYPLKAPTGTCSGSAGSGSSPASSGSSAAPASSPSSAVGGVFGEGASSAPAAAAPTTLATAVSAAPAASTPSTVPAQQPAPAASQPQTSGSCASGQVACSASGFYCISSSQFGMCAFGCATPMAVAAGTTCTNGGIAAAKSKRWSYIRQARRLINF